MSAKLYRLGAQTLRTATLVSTVLFASQASAHCRYVFDLQRDQYIVCPDGTSGPTGCRLERNARGEPKLVCLERVCFEGINEDGQSTAVCSRY